MSSLKTVYKALFQRTLTFTAVIGFSTILVGSVFDIIPNYIFRQRNQGIMFEDVLALRQGDKEDSDE